MNAGRTTLSFLDLALMLLSAFAYAHFVDTADPATQQKMAEEAAQKPDILGVFEYEPVDFFGASTALLTDYAREEIAEILAVQQRRSLNIYVPPLSDSQGGQRLRQWEKVAARSAAIADAFEKAGQDGKMISLEMPEKLVPETDEKRKIILTFSPPEPLLEDK